ncbi:Subunit of the RNA polymerase II mediator complex [Purpureocillium lavendulum]|uniref:Subunit of the RNA polymerase II mediator complex n=1 Tax=Purpureocillium lavendulum TaxID=1247861 RepID=A0AB34FVB8_9HYPO|nr:Subunit of the RNA polymerase II mediator complex [Purpureocillium lavendulum]
MADEKMPPRDAGILSGKAAEARSGAETGGPSSAPAPAPAHSPADPAPAYQEVAPPTSPPAPSGTGVPTVADPFSFPSNAELPPYEAPSSSGPPDSSGAAMDRRPVAIPQVVPDPASPFVAAYPPVLLSHGVTEGTWRSFLETMSAFLTAKVSDRAISHAGDMAKHMSQAPKSFGKGVATHVKSVGKEIAGNAKRGNIIGAAFGVIGGVISIPVATAMGAAGTVMQIPGSAIGAISRRPQTPFERATAYAMVANKKWLHARGLQAQLVPTAGLAQHLGVALEALLGMARAAKRDDASSQLKALEGHIAGLDVKVDAALSLDAHTLWLVLVPVVKEGS